MLGIDPTEIGEVARRRRHGRPLAGQHPQHYHGVPVRHGRLAATINRGNLVLIGTETWGTVRLDANPQLGAEEALAAGFD